MAHRLFHTRILPHILLPGKVEGVLAEFHQKVLVLYEHMGGVDGNYCPCRIVILRISRMQEPPSRRRLRQCSFSIDPVFTLIFPAG